MKNASPTRGSASAQPVECGRIVVSQLAAHLRRQVPHLPLDRLSGAGPDAVGVGIVRRPQQVAIAIERNERDRHVVFLEGRVDLPLEELARLRFEGAAALVGPELLRLPEPPVAVVELLDEPGEPSRAGPAITMRNLGWRSRMPHAKRSTKGSRKFARKNLVFSKTLAALPATRSPGLPTNTVMCQERMTPLCSRVCQSGSHAGSSSLGLTLAIMRLTWRTPPFAT